MAATWGRAEIDVDIDGSDLVRQTRREAERAGQAGGEAMRKSFDGELTDLGEHQLQRLRTRMQRRGTASGRILGRTVAQAFESEIKGRIGRAVDEIGKAFTFEGDFDRWVQGFDSVGEAAGRMRQNLELARSEGRLSAVQYNALSDALDKNYIRLQEAEDSADRARIAEEKGNRERGKSLSLWRRLSHNTRQWTLIIGAVAAALPALSVLSSALSGTLIALGAAFAALVAGAGLAVVGFMGLYNEELKLSEGALASRDALTELGNALSGLQTGIVNNMFANLSDNISNLTNTLIPALEGSINTFAGQVGDSLGRIFDGLSSPVAVQNFKDLLEGFGPIFDNLVRAVVGFGGALGGILVAALPTAIKFTDAIAEVGEAFSTWANSEAGRERLAEFFATAETVMPPLIGLVADLGNLLADLVTPETIASVVTFLESLRGFVPALTGVLQILGALDIFGVLAAALDAVGAFLMPLIPPFKELATIIGSSLIAGLQQLQPSLAALGEAFIPLITTITTIVAAVMPGLINIIQSVIDYLTLFVEALVGGDAESQEFKEGIETMGKVVGAVFDVLAVVIDIALTAIGGMLKITMQLVRGDFTGAFKTAEKMVRDVLAALGIDFDDVVKWVSDMVTEVGNFFRDMERAISGAVDGIIGFLGDLWRPIQDAIGWFGSLFGAANDAKSAGSSASRSGSGGGFAAGGLIGGPRRVLVGEAGPEAIVPLRRTLSRVDPSVRALSAVAQGMSPAMASGGIVSPSRMVTIGEGAVQVFDSGNPRQTAYEVLDVLANRITG